MFISESILSRGITGNINSLALLESMSYLESTYHPAMIPIVENSRLNAYIVDVEDVLRLSEETGEDFDDAVISVAESNGIDPEDVILSIDEVTAYENDGIEDLLNESIFYCVKKPSDIFTFTEALTEEVCWFALEMDDPSIITDFNEASFMKTILDKTNLSNGAKAVVGTAGDLAASGAITAGGALAGMAVAGPLGYAIGALPGVLRSYYTYFKIGKGMYDSANTGKKYGEGEYFESNAKKVENIAKGIKDHPASYAAARLGTLEKMQDKWEAQAANAKDAKEKGIFSKFAGIIGKVIDGAKAKVGVGKGSTKKVHEAYFGEATHRFVNNHAMFAKVRNYIGDKLAKVQDWADKVEKEYNEAPPEKKGIFKKIKVILAKMIRWLSDQLEYIIRPDLTDKDFEEIKTKVDKFNRAEIERLQAENKKFFGLRTVRIDYTEPEPRSGKLLDTDWISSFVDKFTSDLRQSGIL